MQPENNIHNELHEISPLLAGLPKTNVFTVPEGYFDALSSDILLNTIELRNNTGEVPEGYFDQLPTRIMNRIRQEEEESSVLAPIPSNNVFTVPEGYFDRLPADIISRRPQPGRVIGFNRTISFFRYAVAACLAGILGLSLFSALNNANEEQSSVSPVIAAEANKILKENAFDRVMESVTDEEITQYLQSSGQDVNAALMASLADENNLPDADEYIFDDQTLERLMKELHISQSAQN